MHVQVASYFTNLYRNPSMLELVRFQFPSGQLLNKCLTESLYFGRGGFLPPKRSVV